MKKQEKQYYICLDERLISVTEEVYKAYYRPVWKTHYHAGKHGQCCCTDWKLCEGDCSLCLYSSTAGDTLSLDTEYESKAGSILNLLDILNDPTSNVEEIIMGKLMRQELVKMLNGLDSGSRRICELISQGMTEREIAAEFGVRQSTLNYRKRKLMDKLRKQLKDFR